MMEAAIAQASVCAAFSQPQISNHPRKKCHQSFIVSQIMTEWPAGPESTKCIFLNNGSKYHSSGSQQQSG